MEEKREGEGEMNGENSMNVYTLTYIIIWSMGIYFMTLGTQTGALITWGVGKGRRSGGDSRTRGNMYTYGPFMVVERKKLNQYCKATSIH